MIEAGGFHQRPGADRIGHVEGEVAGFDQVTTIFVVVQSAEVAQQQAVGRGVFDELEVAGFAGLEDARGGEVDCRLIGAGGGGSNKLDGGWVAAGVFEVAVEGGDLVVEGGGELLEGAAKDGEMGGGEAGWGWGEGWARGRRLGTGSGRPVG